MLEFKSIVEEVARMSKNKLKCLAGSVCLALILALTGCSSSDSSGTSSYRVRSGDTLYSIAFKYGLDYKSLAKLNGISSPYRIYVGQILDLGQPVAGSGTYIVKSGDTLSGIAQKSGSTVKTLASLNGLSAPYTLYVGQSLKLSGDARSGSRAAAAVNVAALPQSVTTTAQRQTSGVVWSWPTNGRVTAGYSKAELGNPGITIAGQRHQSIKAAADGKVVYSGSALRGYGNLVILTHGTNYLTAYAHNESLLVKEGQQVRRGQPIATMGSTDTDNVELLFELRYQGQTVDPMAYLPAQ